MATGDRIYPSPQEFVVEEFSSTKDYKARDFVRHLNKLYTANEDLTAGAWDATKWTETNIDKQFVGINDNSMNLATSVTTNKNYCLSVGKLCDTQHDYSYALGYKSVAKKDNSFAFGDNCESDGAFSFVSGTGNKSIGLGTAMFGRDSTLGKSASSTTNPGHNFIAGFSNTITDASNCCVVGRMNVTTGSLSLVGGYRNTVQADHALVAGEYNNVQASASYTIAGGYGHRTVAGTCGLVAGKLNIFAGNYSLCVGQGCYAVYPYTVSFGNACKSYAQGAFSGGSDSQASGQYAFAYGTSCVASGMNSFSFGDTCITSANYSFVIGKNNNNTKYYAFAAGYNNKVNGQGSAIFGLSNTLATNGGDNLIAGNTNTATNCFQSIISGIRNDVTGAQNAIIGGYLNKIIGNGTFCSLVVGAENTINGDTNGLIVCGRSNTVNSYLDYGLVCGYSNTIGGNYSVAFGGECKSTGGSSLAGGSKSEATAYASIAFGVQAKASGYASIAFGAYCIASAQESFAGGTNSEATSAYAFAYGKYAKASGYQSVAHGDHSLASGRNSFALGDYTIANQENMFAMGAYNATESSVSADNFIFVIGNGTSDTNKKNSHYLSKQGNAYHAGDVFVKADGTSASGKKVANEDQISDAFDQTATYAAGDFCIYQNTLYKANEAIAAGPFDATKWTATKLTAELGPSPVKQQITLELSDWDGSNKNEVTVSGMSASKAIVCTPVPEYREEWINSDIFVYEQTTDKIIFKCSDVPTQNVVVDLIVW